MRRRTRPKPYDDLNVTPLMDLAWNLLVVFIIMATVTVQGIAVKLPQANPAPSLGKPKTKAVTVLADGRIYLDTMQVTLAELEERLRQYKAADPQVPVVLRGDADVRYQEVVAALDAIKRADITHLGLVTKRLVK